MARIFSLCESKKIGITLFFYKKTTLLEFLMRKIASPDSLPNQVEAQGC